MAAILLQQLFFIFLLFLRFFSSLFCAEKVYIAYMGALPNKDGYSPTEHHRHILSQVLENRTHTEPLVRSYSRSFNGFAAKLTEREISKLAGMEGIISVFPSISHELHTTRSWDFMGFVETVRRDPEEETNTIVGVLDTGIWPESTSFSDESFSPPPLKWKGACNGGTNFKCNNKLIGARFYSPNDDSARDSIGHGTHTASTAVGNTISGANFYGLAEGKARGAVPSARIAMYKVCTENGCQSSEVLAGFDDAISDGVDIISISAGKTADYIYMKDPFAIGSFHALRKGILTSQSAGNSGPRQQSLVSHAPWLLTVAASSMDRALVNYVVLGDNTKFMGRGIYPFDMPKEASLQDGSSLPRAILSCNESSTRSCPRPLQGKIALYDYTEMGYKALDAKAVGMIVTNSHNDKSMNYPLPASSLTADEFRKVETYTHNAKNPVAIILKTVALKDDSAPIVASFSSHGPSTINPEILKPDITAPGVDILAAWPPMSPPSSIQGDERSTHHNIVSGTSMSCPHVAGVAAYVKTFHNDWSPSAIKSALMTSAVPLDETKNPDREFSYGAGHLNPTKAVNPGLIYDAGEADYVKFLCGTGISGKDMQIITGSIHDCPSSSKGSLHGLNYPSIMCTSFEATIHRQVTNVGDPNSTYKALVRMPAQVNISVVPDVLVFSSLNQIESFVVKISAKKAKKKEIYSGSLTWYDGTHQVRSPIVVHVSRGEASRVSYIYVLLLSFLCFLV